MKEIEDHLYGLIRCGIVPSLLLIGEKQQEVLRDNMNLRFVVLVDSEDELSAKIAWQGCIIRVIAVPEEDFVQAYGNKLIN